MFSKHAACWIRTSFARSRQSFHCIRSFAAEATGKNASSKHQNVRKIPSAGKIGLAIAAAITTFSGYLLYQYQRDPSTSYVDRLMRKILGKSYRNYLSIDAGSSLQLASPEENSDAPLSSRSFAVYKPKTDNFELDIPAHLLTSPGVFARDRFINNEQTDQGSFEIQDDLGSFISISWIRESELNYYTGRAMNANKQPIEKTNEDSALFHELDEWEHNYKSHGYRTVLIELVNLAPDNSNKPSVKQDKENDIIFGAFMIPDFFKNQPEFIPEPTLPKKDDSENSELTPVRGSKQLWRGSLMFIRDGYLYEICMHYPIAILNYAKLKKARGDDMPGFQPPSENVTGKQLAAFRDYMSRFESGVCEPKEIVTQLKRELLSIATSRFVTRPPQQSTNKQSQQE